MSWKLDLFERANRRGASRSARPTMKNLAERANRRLLVRFARPNMVLVDRNALPGAPPAPRGLLPATRAGRRRGELRSLLVLGATRGAGSRSRRRRLSGLLCGRPGCACRTLRATKHAARGPLRLACSLDCGVSLSLGRGLLAGLLRLGLLPIALPRCRSLLRSGRSVSLCLRHVLLPYSLDTRSGATRESRGPTALPASYPPLDTPTHECPCPASSGFLWGPSSASCRWLRAAPRTSRPVLRPVVQDRESSLPNACARTGSRSSPIRAARAAGSRSAVVGLIPPLPPSRPLSRPASISSVADRERASRPQLSRRTYWRSRSACARTASAAFPTRRPSVRSAYPTCSSPAACTSASPSRSTPARPSSGGL